MKRQLKISGDTLVEAALFLLIFVWFGIFAICGVDDHHDGLVLNAAMEVASGKVLFRDSFFHYGLLQPYFFAGFLKVFGEYLIVLKLLTVAAYAFTAVLTYVIWKSLMPRLMAILTVLFWLYLAPFYYLFSFMHIWSSVFAALGMMLCEYAMMRYFRTGAGKCLFGAGVAAGCVFGFRQPVGFFTIVAVLIFLGVEAAAPRQRDWRRMGREYMLFSAGAGVVLGLGAWYLLANGAWSAWYEQTVAYPAQWQASGFRASNVLEHFFPTNWFFRILPVLTLTVGACQLGKAAGRDQLEYPDRMLLLLAALGMASWPQYYPITCPRHLFWSAIPMLGFYPWVLNWTAERFSEPVRRRILGFAFPVVLALLWMVLPHINVAPGVAAEKLRSFYGHGKFFESGVLKGMLLLPRSHRYLEYVWKLHRNLPEGEYYLNTSDAALFNAFYPSGKRFGPMPMNWKNTVYPDYEARMEEFIREKQPILFVTTDTRTYMLYPPRLRRSPPLPSPAPIPGGDRAVRP